MNYSAAALKINIVFKYYIYIAIAVQLNETYIFLCIYESFYVELKVENTFDFFQENIESII